MKYVHKRVDFGMKEGLCCLKRSFFFCPQRAVELLLKHNGEINAKDKFWHTPLHMAAAKWATECALVLIPHICSLDVADRSGRTPLHHAAYSGHGEVRITHPSPIFLCVRHYRYTGCGDLWKTIVSSNKSLISVVTDGELALKQRC